MRCFLNLFLSYLVVNIKCCRSILKVFEALSASLCSRSKDRTWQGDVYFVQNFLKAHLYGFSSQLCMGTEILLNIWAAFIPANTGQPPNKLQHSDSYISPGVLLLLWWQCHNYCWSCSAREMFYNHFQMMQWEQARLRYHLSGTTWWPWRKITLKRVCLLQSTLTVHLSQYTYVVHVDVLDLASVWYTVSVKHFILSLS